MGCLLRACRRSPYCVMRQVATMTVFTFKIFNSPCPDYMSEVACTGKTEQEARDVAEDLCTRTQAR